MSPFSWLYVDLNSYFAAVEQQFDSALRGRPVAVGPEDVPTGTVIAASVEAKKFGVKTGTLVAEAKRLCPGIVFRNGGHERYRQVHDKIVAAVDKVVPVAAVLSIDEVACRLIGRERTAEQAIRLAYEVKERIRRDAGDYLTCSIGLAPNRYLAKVASDMQKPDGLIGIQKPELPGALHKLQLRDFPGIGPKMEQRIRRYGIETVEQLCSLGEADMRLIWGGVNGARFWLALRGEEYEESPTERRSIGHSHVLPPDLRTNAKAWLIAQKLLHKAAARLRKNEFWCGELTLHVSFQGSDEGFSETLRLIECCDDMTLLEALRTLWAEVPRFQRPLKVGVVLGRLVAEDMHTLSLFANPRREKLSRALDDINGRYGRDTVKFASMEELSKDAAPTRIAFTNIPDFDS